MNDVPERQTSECADSYFEQPPNEGRCILASDPVLGPLKIVPKGRKQWEGVLRGQPRSAGHPQEDYPPSKFDGDL